MFSEKQKRVLFGTRIVPRTRYVRVPLQMANGVRELKTDIYLAKIIPAYEQNFELLHRIAAEEPVYHIMLDISSTKNWQSTYEKICSAYRSVNGSRILRRMHITGFRMVNVETRFSRYAVVSDSFIAGIDQTCVIFDALARALLPSGRYNVDIAFDGTSQRLRAIRAAATSNPEWSRNWRLEMGTIDTHGLNRLTLTAELPHLIAAANIVINMAGTAFRSMAFRFMTLRLDTQELTDKDIFRRYGTADINVMLSGYRLRRFQKFGLLTHSY